MVFVVNNTGVVSSIHSVMMMGKHICMQTLYVYINMNGDNNVGYRDQKKSFVGCMRIASPNQKKKCLVFHFYAFLVWKFFFFSV